MGLSQLKLGFKTGIEVNFFIALLAIHEVQDTRMLTLLRWLLGLVVVIVVVIVDHLWLAVGIVWKAHTAILSAPYGAQILSN